MIAHVHNWEAVANRPGRHHCACGVYAYRHATGTIVPYVCQKQLVGKRHCGAESVHVSGDRQASRCAEHAQQQHSSAS